jgi:hypothetical protein
MSPPSWNIGVPHPAFPPSDAWGLGRGKSTSIFEVKSQKKTLARQIDRMEGIGPSPDRDEALRDSKKILERLQREIDAQNKALKATRNAGMNREISLFIRS